MWRVVVVKDCESKKKYRSIPMPLKKAFDLVTKFSKRKGLLAWTENLTAKDYKKLEN